MTITHPLVKLGAVLHEYAPKLRSFDGSTRLVLDILDRETIEVFPLAGDYLRIVAVYADPTGAVEQQLVAVTYGPALAAPVVREYADLRREQVDNTTRGDTHG